MGGSRARSFGEVKNVPNWKDLDPRVGVAYDLFGNGRTALKVALGRYVSKAAITDPQANNPIQTSINSVTRTWNDSFYPVGDPRRGNYMPDCDLANRGLNGECGAMANQNFGGQRPHHPLRGRCAARLRRARLQLGLHGRSAARAAPGRLHDRRLLPQLVRQLPRHGQHAGDAGGLRSVLRHGAEGLAAAGRRRLPGLRSLRRDAGEVRPGQQRHHAVGQLREDAARQRLLQRRPSTRGSAGASWSAAAWISGAA